MHRVSGLAALFVCLLIAAIGPVARSVGATTSSIFTVNSTLDEHNVDASTGMCVSTPSGKCTLRAAVEAANFASTPSQITVPPGVYVLTRPGYDDNALVGDLDIKHDLTIQGGGSGATIVDGNGAVTHDRVFQILSPASAVTMAGMTIRNGQSLSSTVGVIGGGGLYMEGSGHLQLNDVIFAGNTALNGGGLYTNFSSQGGSLEMDHVVVRTNIVTGTGLGAGGGIYAYIPSSFSRIVIQDSQVYSNSTDGTGGGLYVTGNSTDRWSIQRSQIYSNTAASGGAIGNSVPLTMSDSVVRDNHVSYDGGAIEAFSPFVILRTTLAANSAGRFGGAIFSLSDYANPAFPEFAHIEQSTLSSNFAKYGGGIYHDGYFLHGGSLLMLLNSTVSNNDVSGGNGGGGGIYVYNGQLQLLNATIASNHVNVGGGPGGGLYITATSTFTAQNSLIADNWHSGSIFTGPIPDDCFSHGTTGMLAFDLILTTTNCYVTGAQVGNINGQDPHLGPLQYYGGTTQTRALLPGSPAIDTGATLGCTDDLGNPLTIDQRGGKRPINGACDIGAYEYGGLQFLYLPLVKK